MRWITRSTLLSPKMGDLGLYLESWRAVVPVSVKTAMALISRSSAAWAIDSQMVSATERRTCPDWLRSLARISGSWLSVSSTILAIILTASTGYLPAAVSAESITASVPS